MLAHRCERKATIIDLRGREAVVCGLATTQRVAVRTIAKNKHQFPFVPLPGKNDIAAMPARFVNCIGSCE